MFVLPFGEGPGEGPKDDGPNFSLYADELERKFKFKRDRSNVRKWCEINIMPLMRSVFPIEKNPVPSRLRRWERAAYGELYQHDSTPRHIWGPKEDSQHIILSLDDATRKIMASRVCEREMIPEHFAMLEESFLRYGIPETLYTDGFTMFGHEGEDIKTQFGRMSRAFGINHLIAPTPQAKGKIERAMRTFQHRLVVTLRAEGVGNAERANVVTAAHCDFWNAKHVNEETGMVPDERVRVLTAEGRICMRSYMCEEPPFVVNGSRHTPFEPSVQMKQTFHFCSPENSTFAHRPTLTKLTIDK